MYKNYRNSKKVRYLKAKDFFEEKEECISCNLNRGCIERALRRFNIDKLFLKPKKSL